MIDEKAIEFESEISILKGLDNDGIVKMHEAGKDGVCIGTNNKVFRENISYIVMDYEENEFFDFCVCMGAQGEEAGKFFLHQLIDSIKYLHDQDIAHRDLKLENMLIDEDLNLKLVDFGLAVKSDIDNLTQWCGTPCYAAPEIHRQVPYNAKKADIFSLGVILFSIVVGRKPFDNATSSDYFYNLIKTNEVDAYFEFIQAKHLSPEFKDLIVRMLSYDSSSRPSIDEIRSHPWMCRNGIKIVEV